MTDSLPITWCQAHDISANQTVTLIKHGEKVCYVAAYSGDLIHDEFGKPALSNCRFVSKFLTDHLEASRQDDEVSAEDEAPKAPQIAEWLRPDTDYASDYLTEEE